MVSVRSYNDILFCRLSVLEGGLGGWFGNIATQIDLNREKFK